jgi:hypothetical protein
MLKVLSPEKPARTIIREAPPMISTKMDIQLIILITFCELFERTYRQAIKREAFKRG